MFKHEYDEYEYDSSYKSGGQKTKQAESSHLKD